VYTHEAGRTPALQQNWQSSEKSQHLKKQIFNEHPVLGGIEIIGTISIDVFFSLCRILMILTAKVAF